MSDWLHNWLTTKLSDEQLQELRSATFDRWTWDTGADADRRLFDALDEESVKRSLPPATINFVSGSNIIVNEDSGTITIHLNDSDIQA